MSPTSPTGANECIFLLHFALSCILYFHSRSREVFSCSPEVAAKFNKLKTWVATADATAEKYKSPPAAVDFSGAKTSIRDKELVDTLEAFYKSSTPPAEAHGFPEEELQSTEQKIAYLTELDALNKEFLPVLEKEIEFQKNNRTSKDTTMVDMQMNYPLIHEEIENELESREWFKDTGIGSSK
jgi:hypothetical protein